MNFDITVIVKLVVEILLSIASLYLIPWLREKVGAAKLAKIVDTIDILVAAAEQIAARDGYDGEWKKEHVKSMLQGCGFTIDEAIDDYIEAAVLALHSQLLTSENC